MNPPLYQIGPRWAGPEDGQRLRSFCLFWSAIQWRESSTLIDYIFKTLMLSPEVTIINMEKVKRFREGVFLICLLQDGMSEKVFSELFGPFNFERLQLRMRSRSNNCLLWANTAAASRLKWTGSHLHCKCSWSGSFIRFGEWRTWWHTICSRNLHFGAQMTK